jgi:uncharacterized metal-binding protein
MACGKTHAASTKGLAIGVCAGGLASTQLYLDQILLIAAFIPIGIFMTPDHDVDSGNISFWYIRRYMGRTIEYIWYRAWMPYAVSYKHRSPLTHLPIISTVIRMIYLVFPFIVFVIRDQKNRYNFLQMLFFTTFAYMILIAFWCIILTPLVAVNFFGYDPIEILFLLFTALALSDLLHILFDSF